MPVALITAWLPAVALATEDGTRRLARITVIWPTSPAVLIGSASSMRRHATRTSTPVGASARTMARPMKPLPPKTVTCLMWFMDAGYSPMSAPRKGRQGSSERSRVDLHFASDLPHQAAGQAASCALASCSNSRARRLVPADDRGLDGRLRLYCTMIWARRLLGYLVWSGVGTSRLCSPAPTTLID